MVGQLLIAHPLLNDGFFNRSVVYITAHNEEGTVGFCLNFKTQFLLRDIRPQVKNGNFPIYEGGPVAKNQLFFLHTLGDAIPDSSKIKGNLYFGGDFNELIQKIDLGYVTESQVRFFAGYSGWDEKQLDREIKDRHWLVHKPANDEFLSGDITELWGEQLGDFKRSYSIFANFGYDPSLN